MKKFLDNTVLSTTVGMAILLGLAMGIIHTNFTMLFAGLWVIVAALIVYNALGRNKNKNNETK